MKKVILVMAILALLVPASALAATEFSLGGFIKFDSYWDSSQSPHAKTSAVPRNNDALFHHGQFNMTAEESRLVFTIKGPKIWGATTSAIIDINFDTLLDNNFSALSGAVGPPGATHSYIPKLRLAMFRLNWPDTELMFGQYYGLFSEAAPETAGDSQYTGHGWFSQRVPQIRLTQKFLDGWNVAAMIAKPTDPATVDNRFGNSVPAGSVGTSFAAGALDGRSSETPQLQARIGYEKDLWGKAAFWGRPRGFVAQLNGAWQRTRYRNNFAAIGLNTFGQNAFGASAVIQGQQQYLNPWCLQGTLFIPVLPTYSANLAGTASLSTQMFIGEGMANFGGGRGEDNSWLDFSGRRFDGAFIYNRKLMQQFGGYVQGQYWFSNQWFVNVIWGFIRDYGIDQSTSAALAGQQATNPVGYKYASNNDQQKMQSEFNVTLWYRPIEALKFGVQYAYERSDWLQRLNNPVVAAAGQVQGQPSAGSTTVGDAHRLEFVAIMFF